MFTKYKISKISRLLFNFSSPVSSFNSKFELVVVVNKQKVSLDIREHNPNPVLAQAPQNTTHLINFTLIIR